MERAAWVDWLDMRIDWTHMTYVRNEAFGNNPLQYTIIGLGAMN